MKNTDALTIVGIFEQAAKQTQQSSEKSLEILALRFGIAFASHPYLIRSKGRQNANAIDLDLHDDSRCVGTASSYPLVRLIATLQDGQHQ
jgi:hypothetical protein